MWLDEHRPVIALSLRMDRIDNFWFTLLHEYSHIIHEDGLSVDSDLTGEDASILAAAKPPMERRADNDAAAMLIPPEVLTSFIRRVAPLYSKARIIQFAHRIKVHPGIIVGQLRYRGEMSYRANTEMLAKIRDKVSSSSLTDGWGNTVS
jgi:HTH-type transcriptional regulator/antitoxin HigA